MQLRNIPVSRAGIVITFVQVAVIAGFIAIMLNALFNDSVSPTDMFGSMAYIILFMILGLLTLTFSLTNDVKYPFKRYVIILAIGLVSMMVVTETDFKYSEDCSTLQDISGILHKPCIEYAMNHPDATGAEIIDAMNLKVKSLKSASTDIDTSILDRPLKP